MSRRTHLFVEEYQGLVGFGLDRETDEASLISYLQMFSDDDLMATMRSRFTDDDIEEVFQLISRLMRKHLDEKEYHNLFLKK